jgi:hypothetical protein
MISSKAFVKRKDLSKAVSLLEQAADLTPESKEILDRLAQVRALLSRE